MHGVLNMDTTMVREAGECALCSYYTRRIGQLEFKGQTLSYQGTFGVGYLVMRFDVRTAKQQILMSGWPGKLESLSVARDYMSIPSYVTQEMRNQKRSAFVTLKKREIYGDVSELLNRLPTVWQRKSSEMQ